MLGSGIGRNLTAGLEDANCINLSISWIDKLMQFERGNRTGEFATVRRSMRRFATWCTGHRKTVIGGWIVALVVAIVVSGAVGSAFSEDFKLPASDSTDAFDLLESKFPAQSGDTTTIVF